MTFDEYQKLAAVTSGVTYFSETFKTEMFAALGLAGEAGEVADMIKKEWGHEHQIPVEEYVDELGDVLWYISELCTAKEISLADVARRNLEKLSERYPNGFTPDDSQRRRDMKLKMIQEG